MNSADLDLFMELVLYNMMKEWLKEHNTFLYKNTSPYLLLERSKIGCKCERETEDSNTH